MAELTLLVNSTDTALLNGSAVSPAATGAVAGGFASVLGAQLTPGKGVASTESPPPRPGSAVTAVAEGGETAPLNGKTLPVTAVPLATPPVLTTEPAALESTLLSAIAQGLPSGSVPAAVAPLAGIRAALPDGGLLARDGNPQGALPQPALPRSMAENTIAARLANTSTVPGTLLNVQIPQTGAAQTPLSGLAVPVDGQQQAAAVIPAMLGKPVSEAARQTLARLNQTVGSVKSLRTEMTSTASGASLNSGQSLGLPTTVSGVNAAMRMDVLNAATATQNAVAVELRPTNQPLLNTIAASDESLNTQLGLPRLNAAPLTGVTPTLTVATPVGQPAWANDLGQRVTWLAGNELRQAQLQLNPRNLGAVEVRIVYGLDQQLSVSFNAANPIARDALDASLPRLREMLEQQGLQLADANVSHESPEEREQRRAIYDAADTSDDVPLAGDDADAELAANVPAAYWAGEGMLDAYA